MVYYEKGGIPCGTPDNTSIESNETNKPVPKLELYPNPASTEVNIQIPQEFRHQQNSLQIIGMNGRLIHTYVNISSETYSIDLKDITAGLYLLRLVSENNCISSKLIKE